MTEVEEKVKAFRKAKAKLRYKEEKTGIELVQDENYVKYMQATKELKEVRCCSLKDYRLRNYGMSQVQLARLVGLKPQNLLKYEKDGIKGMRVELALKIRRLLGMTVEELESLITELGECNNDKR